MSDNVKHPNHYCKGGIECIDAINSAVSNITDPFEAYCTGNIIKYIWRWNDKNGVEDLHKAMQYIEFIERYRANSHTPTVTTTAHKPTQAEYEELFAPVEPVKGKYDGLNDDELEALVCDQFKTCSAGCPLDNKDDNCRFDGWRKIAIAHLEGLEVSK